MTTDVLDELLKPYDEAATWGEAEQALDEIARSSPPAELGLGDLYDQVAGELAEEEDHEGAVRAQRKALAHRCEHRELGREMLAWYLLKAGRRGEFEVLISELRSSRPDDPQLELLVGNALSDAGFEHEALAAYERAMTLARRVDDEQSLIQARAERQWSRSLFGLTEDEQDRLALAYQAARSRVAPEQTQIVLGVFLRGVHAEVLERWPDLREDLVDADAYCRSMERRLREVATVVGRNPQIAPMDPAGLIAHSHVSGLDPDSSEARAGYAAALGTTDRAMAWPPRRNEPCWCGSGFKYKRCCAGS